MEKADLGKHCLLLHKPCSLKCKSVALNVKTFVLFDHYTADKLRLPTGPTRKFFDSKIIRKFFFKFLFPSYFDV